MTGKEIIKAILDHGGIDCNVQVYHKESDTFKSVIGVQTEDDGDIELILE